MIREKKLGSTTVTLPEIGIGTWLYHGTPELLRQGVDLGAAFIDTAEFYKNEELVGQAIRGIRERVFLATKVNHWRREEVKASADESLRKLGVERIDLYQLHWPNSAVPIEETLSAMEDLVDEGKVRFIGVSNFTLPELRRAERAMHKHRIVANQLRYSIVHRTIEPRLLPYCQDHDITVIAYSPLGHQFSALQAADSKGALAAVARETGHTMAQVALNWCLVKPAVVVIPKTESLEHMADNCRSSDWRLSLEQMQRLDRTVQYRSRSRMEQALRRFVRGALQWRQRILKG